MGAREGTGWLNRASRCAGSQKAVDGVPGVPPVWGGGISRRRDSQRPSRPVPVLAGQLHLSSDVEIADELKFNDLAPLAAARPTASTPKCSPSSGRRDLMPGIWLP